MPGATAIGNATVTLTASNGTTQSATIGITGAAPGPYTLNGAGLVAANVLRLRAGTQVYENVYQVSGSQIVAAPIDLGPESDQVYLTLYGTGLRREPAVTVTIGGRVIPVLFSGASPDFAGLDQINVGPLPRGLTGVVSLEVSAGGVAANTTSIAFSQR